jgi:hypothetical protein
LLLPSTLLFWLGRSERSTLLHGRTGAAIVTGVITVGAAHFVYQPCLYNVICY